LTVLCGLELFATDTGQWDPMGPTWPPPPTTELFAMELFPANVVGGGGHVGPMGSHCPVSVANNSNPHNTVNGQSSVASLQMV
jgi:hypothetical protein